jgi:hypothetical protein
LPIRHIGNSDFGPNSARSQLIAQPSELFFASARDGKWEILRCEPARRQGASDSGGSIEDDGAQGGMLALRCSFSLPK